MKTDSTSIFEKSLEPTRVPFGAANPNHITIINQGKDVRFEVKNMQRAREKPRKMPEKTNTTINFANKLVNVVVPSQCVID